jgi:hypothetical protein
MKSLRSEQPDGFCKCDFVLRQALNSANEYTDAAEAVFNGQFEADAVALRLYEDLLALIADYPDNPLAEGKGDLRLPAAPRYTECRITQLGLERLTDI